MPGLASTRNCEVPQFLIDVSQGRPSPATLTRYAAPDIGPVTEDRPFFLQVPEELSMAVCSLLCHMG